MIICAFQNKKFKNLLKMKTPIYYKRPNGTIEAFKSAEEANKYFQSLAFTSFLMKLVYFEAMQFHDVKLKNPLINQKIRKMDEMASDVQKFCYSYLTDKSFTDEKQFDITGDFYEVVRDMFMNNEFRERIFGLHAKIKSGR